MYKDIYTCVMKHDDAMTKMREGWNEWVADKEYSKKLEEYRNLISEEE